MKKKNNGFTLVEILAVIVIMGILTLMALPGLKALQNKNNNTKFIKYQEYLIESAKLYTDSYGEDMFGFNGKGCYIISYNELKKKHLIKDYADSNISCNNQSTFVRVEKNGNKTKYYPSIVCKNKRNDILYQNITTKCQNVSSKLPEVYLRVEDNDDYEGWSKSKKFVITLASSIGLIDNVSIKYGFTTNINEIPSKLFSHDFKNKYGEKEIDFDFVDNSLRNGKLYLYVDASSVINTEGFPGSIFYSRELNYDTIPPSVPIVNNDFFNIWYNLEKSKQKNYVIKLTSFDNESGVNYYRYKYPDSENIWHVYTKSNKNEYFTEPFKLDRNEKVLFQACDYLGNCSASAESFIKIDKTVPSISNSNSSLNAWVNSSIKLTSSVSDNLSGINKVLYGFSEDTVYNDKWDSINNNDFIKSWSNSQNNSIYTKVIDNAGNVSKIVPGGTLKIDKDPPAISNLIISSNSNPTYNPVTISGNVADYGIGVKNVYYSYNSNGSGKSPFAKLNKGSFSDKWSAVTYKNVYVIAEDKLGNLSLPVFAGTVNIQTPSITITPSNAYKYGVSTWTDSSGSDIDYGSWWVRAVQSPGSGWGFGWYYIRIPNNKGFNHIKINGINQSGTGYECSGSITVNDREVGAWGFPNTVGSGSVSSWFSGSYVTVRLQAYVSWNNASVMRISSIELSRK